MSQFLIYIFSACILFLICYHLLPTVRIEWTEKEKKKRKLSLIILLLSSHLFCFFVFKDAYKGIFIANSITFILSLLCEKIIEKTAYEKRLNIYAYFIQLLERCKCDEDRKRMITKISRLKTQLRPT
jgi:hypothetical protein